MTYFVAELPLSKTGSLAGSLSHNVPEVSPTRGRAPAWDLDILLCGLYIICFFRILP